MYRLVAMGNNHDKYFGKDKRKILILGLEKSGKTGINISDPRNYEYHCIWQTIITTIPAY